MPEDVPSMEVLGLIGVPTRDGLGHHERDEFKARSADSKLEVNGVRWVVVAQKLTVRT